LGRSSSRYIGGRQICRRQLLEDLIANLGVQLGQDIRIEVAAENVQDRTTLIRSYDREQIGDVGSLKLIDEPTHLGCIAHIQRVKNAAHIIRVEAEI
jgi:hypothetical protein